MKAFVLNCPVDLCNIEDALQKAKNAIENRENYQIITINPEMIMNAQENKAFFEIINNSNLNIIDGVGVKIALRLQKINQEQIRGVDFSRELIKLASENNYRVAFLGAKDEVVNLAKENFLKQYPKLNFVYVRNGYFDNEELIIDEIKNANPQILLVGLGSPKQEEIIVKLKSVLNGCVMVGVGGSFDVFSGITKESPIIFRKLGLEWLYRTLMQPERFKRIFPVLPIFLIKCIIKSVQKKG
ncbi:WecB/TagA/CpsF family glycosyltransferase [bacterium]|nr:WecB/TagA/CpsF family glycosyltransferase [bacterium]